MKTIFSLVAISGLIALSACGGNGGNQGAPNAGIQISDSNGYCIDSVIEANNQVNLDFRSYKEHKDDEHIRHISRSCKALRDLVAANSCLANTSSGDDLITIAYSGKMKRACEVAISGADFILVNE